MPLQAPSGLEQCLSCHQTLISARRLYDIRHRGPVATRPLALVETLIRQLQERVRRGRVSITDGPQSTGADTDCHSHRTMRHPTFNAAPAITRQYSWNPALLALRQHSRLSLAS
jgi:hypothetical protein